MSEGSESICATSMLLNKCHCVVMLNGQVFGVELRMAKWRQLSWESLFVTEITLKPRVTVQWNEDHLSLFLYKSPIISSPPHHPDAFSPLPLLLFSPSPSRRPSSFQNTLSFSSSLPVSRPTSHFPVRPSVYPSICHTWFVFKCRRSYQVQTCLLHH